jgi:C4-dicarboxylate transporter
MPTDGVLVGGGTRLCANGWWRLLLSVVVVVVVVGWIVPGCDAHVVTRLVGVALLVGAVVCRRPVRGTANVAVYGEGG